MLDYIAMIGGMAGFIFLVYLRTKSDKKFLDEVKKEIEEEERLEREKKPHFIAHI